MPEKPNMIVELTVKIPIDFNDWDGWRSAPSSVGDFVSRTLRPHFPKMTVRSYGDMTTEEIDYFLRGVES